MFELLTVLQCQSGSKVLVARRWAMSVEHLAKPTSNVGSARSILQRVRTVSSIEKEI